MIHNFDDDLNFALNKEHKLDRIYCEYFKNVNTIETITDKSRQHNGIDRQITLTSGEVILTQEKWRRREFTGDFLIEYCNVFQYDECKKPGWIYYIDADYIFTVYAASEVVKIYPVVQLKLAWDEHEKEWIKKYNLKPAKNWGYTTHNVAVPCDILEPAILEKMRFDYQRTLFT